MPDEPCDKLAVQKLDDRYGLVVQKLDTGRYGLRHECCQGVCWNARIKFTGKTDGRKTPFSFTVLYPIIPCGPRLNCNVANDYDTDTCLPVHRRGKLQWGSAMNLSGYALTASNTGDGICKSTQGNIGVYFGQTEVRDSQNPANDREAEDCRIFVRSASLFSSMWLCYWLCLQGQVNDCAIRDPYDAILGVPEAPRDCMYFDVDTDEHGRIFLFDPDTGEPEPFSMIEPLWGAYYYYVLHGRCCTITIRWWDVVIPGIEEYRHDYVSWPFPMSADSRFRLEYPPSEESEAWLRLNNPTTTVGGSVFRLNAEMIQFIGANPSWVNSWRPPPLPSGGGPASLSSLPAIPRRNLLLYAGEMRKICGHEMFVGPAGNYVNTVIDTAAIIGWEPCHIEHQCLTMPTPVRDVLELRPRPPWLPSYPAPYLGRKAAPAPPDAFLPESSPPVCLHLDTEGGQCRKGPRNNKGYIFVLFSGEIV